MLQTYKTPYTEFTRSTQEMLPGDLFFQAEDGIRGGHVTGVQTCALPISFLTYALGHDQPVVRTEYTLTEEDLPPLESTEFIAEKAPKKCRNRSVTTVHTDGYKAPSQGCASATSHPMGIAWILFTFCLLLRLRLASNSDRVYAAKQCKN